MGWIMRKRLNATRPASSGLVASIAFLLSACSQTTNTTPLGLQEHTVTYCGVLKVSGGLATDLDARNRTPSCKPEILFDRKITEVIVENPPPDPQRWQRSQSEPVILGAGVFATPLPYDGQVHPSVIDFDNQIIKKYNGTPIDTSDKEPLSSGDTHIQLIVKLTKPKMPLDLLCVQAMKTPQHQKASWHFLCYMVDMHATDEQLRTRAREIVADDLPLINSVN